jgi:Mg-chelatase subunit ChlI
MMFYQLQDQLKSVWPFVHNILMVGSPGTGKTLLARAIPGILPEMSIDESLDVILRAKNPLRASFRISITCPEK